MSQPTWRVGRALALVATLLVPAVAAIALTLPTNVAACPVSNAVAPPPARSPVQHVFFLIKENHALENYFATYPGVIGTPPTGQFLLSYASNASVFPFPLSGYSTPDLPHDRLDAVAAWDGGRNDHFVAQAASSGAAVPRDAVGYYTARQVGVYFDLAQNYTLDDMFFSGILGPTLPNRIFDLAGTSGNWTSDDIPPAGSLTFPTVLDQLSAEGISWAYDFSGSEANLTPTLFPSIAGDGCRLAQVQPVENLPEQVDSSMAPAVTFIDPSHDYSVSEHPPGNVSVGAAWTASVLRTIFDSPIGASSAVFLFYDESGGFWDPIPPPVNGPLGDGLRVPFLLVSPWTRGGHITHLPLDPASLLKFVDANWGLPLLNARVAQATPIDGLFNFSSPQAPRLPVGTVPLARAPDRSAPAPGGIPVGAIAGIIPAAARPEAWTVDSSPSTTRSRCSSNPRAPSSRSR